MPTPGPSAPSDLLSEVLEQIEVRGIVTGGFAVRGPWVSRGEISRPLKLVALVAGRAEVRADGPGKNEGPVALGPGDVVLLNHRTRLEVTGGTGDGRVRELVPETSFDAMALAAADLDRDTVVIGGWIDVTPAGLTLLSTALPGVLHVRASRTEASPVGELVGRLFAEASSQRPGSAFAVRQCAQLLLLEVLRTYVDQTELPAGWLRLLIDDELAPAVRLIHGEPGRSWRLLELARAANMSRTSFAERFRSVAGVPPLAYLSQWRMLLAQRALRAPGARVGAVATEVGYRSEAAFSNAFKREVGESPLHYRQRLQRTS
ncbi:AraC family transcriptional regulator [Microlunatus kandeliicorticis]|uniref:AraC family transcriptional regulator n=1 Tax=Microlunatus kandeliicorticis TaxID=1759536 RepID=UPI001C71D15B|nr:AraC family transcriptional regulator [Microlunatus kandeliicorticis]